MFSPSLVTTNLYLMLGHTSNYVCEILKVCSELVSSIGFKNSMEIFSRLEVNFGGAVSTGTPLEITSLPLER